MGFRSPGHATGGITVAAVFENRSTSSIRSSPERSEDTRLCAPQRETEGTPRPGSKHQTTARLTLFKSRYRVRDLVTLRPRPVSRPLANPNDLLPTEQILFPTSALFTRLTARLSLVRQRYLQHVHLFRRRHSDSFLPKSRRSAFWRSAQRVFSL